MNIKTIVNKKFSQLCLDKYKAMVELDQTEDFLDQENFGNIKVFVNPKEKPKYVLAEFNSEDGLKKIFVGGTF